VAGNGGKCCGIDKFLGAILQWIAVRKGVRRLKNLISLPQSKNQLAWANGDCSQDHGQHFGAIVSSGKSMAQALNGSLMHGSPPNCLCVRLSNNIAAGRLVAYFDRSCQCCV